MKLSHLSFAIFAAISLAACGGSGDNAVDNTNPKPKPKPEPPKKEVPKKDDSNASAEKIVDPTQTGVVGNLDLKKDASQGGMQYIRGAKSEFDREDNPKKPTSATAILGVNLNEQNPQLSNIVLAELKDKKGNRLVQYAGNPREIAPNIWSPLSLQRQNELNVEIALAGSAVDAQQFIKMLQDRKKLFMSHKANYTDANINALPTADRNEAKAQRQFLDVAISNLNTAIKAVNADPNILKNTALLSNYGVYRWGDGIPTSKDAMGQSGVQPSSTGPEANGLVALNYHDVRSNKLESVDVQGSEEQSRSSTRIFGRNFDTNDAVSLGSSYSVVKNSYLDATTGLYSTTGFGLNAAKPNDLSGSMQAVQNWKNDTWGNVAQNINAMNPGQQTRFDLGVIPTNLMKVQYGRVTNDLDPPANAKLTKAIQYSRQVFLNKGDDRSVDTYFYRGVDATTLKQMDALKDKKMTYQGHALMYGMDNSWHGNLGDKLPNAFGAGSAHGVGHFVTANVDLNDKTIVGGIYNAWQDGISTGIKKDVLVKFSGKIFGNTAIGTAERTYKAGEGDFRASFFGSNAEELGGSVNSTTYQQVYGPNPGQDIWGGVFGAQRAITAPATPSSPGLSNKWLGDIPKIQ